MQLKISNTLFYFWQKIMTDEHTKEQTMCWTCKFWPSQISSATLNPLFIIYTSKENKYFVAIEIRTRNEGFKCCLFRMALLVILTWKKKKEKKKPVSVFTLCVAVRYVNYQQMVPLITLGGTDRFHGKHTHTLPVRIYTCILTVYWTFTL